MHDVLTLPFSSYRKSVPAILDAVGADRVLAEQTAVLLKPNLVNASPHPVTTPPECCEAVIAYVRAHCNAEIVVAEGCGDALMETGDVFEALGYADMAKRLGVALLDLNRAPLRTVRIPECPVFPEMHLPEAAFTNFIISLPVLKAHSLAGLTGTLKNMLGFAPPEHYSGVHGSWKKAVFHGRLQQSILDLARYVRPHLTLLDATQGLASFHLGGDTLSPPPNRLIAGGDPRAVDRTAADLLGIDWRTIRHVAERLQD